MSWERLPTLFLPREIDIPTFEGQWVMAEITGVDENQWPIEGIVLDVSTLREVWDRYYQESDGSRRNFYIFQPSSSTKIGDKFTKDLSIHH